MTVELIDVPLCLDCFEPDGPDHDCPVAEPEYVGKHERRGDAS